MKQDILMKYGFKSKEHLDPKTYLALADDTGVLENARDSSNYR